MLTRGRVSCQLVKQVGNYATAATATKTESAVTGEYKLEKLPSGVTVATVQQNWPMARISIIFRAGSRHEDRSTRGLNHLIRRASGLSNSGSTGLNLTRSIAQMGAGLECSATREHLTFTLDASTAQVDDAFGFLADSALRPLFYHWELGDTAYKHMKRDTEFLHRRDHTTLLFERLHQAAFKNGLGSPLFAPSHRIGDISYESIQKFMANHFSPDRCTVVGMGVSHDALLDMAETLEFPDAETREPNDTKTKFYGGEERVDNGSPLAQVAIVSEGASLADQDSALAHAVLSHVLGHGRPNVMYGGSGSPLSQAVGGVCSNAAFASSVNLSYSDAGAFGFYVVANSGEIGNAVKAARNVVISTAKSGVKSDDLERAKNQLKTAIHIDSESISNRCDDLGVQASLFGKYTSASELTAKVDAISAGQVNEAAKKLLTSKAALSAVGDLEDVPLLYDFA